MLAPATSAGAFIFDVASKAWADHALSDGSVMVAPFLTLHLAYNSGISFSLFASSSPAVLSGVSALLIIGLAWMAFRARVSMERFGLALILGGAIGNLVDRVQDDFVTDFIQVHAGGWLFPTFNFADVAISAGVMCVLAVMVVDQRKPVQPHEPL